MKIVCIPACSDPNRADAELMLIEIKPSETRQILEVAQKCSSFLREMRIEGYEVDCVSLNSALDLRIFGGGILAKLDTESDLADAEWLNIDESEVPMVFGPEAEETLIHAASIEVHVGWVSFIAMGELTGERYESPLLTIEQLSAIVAGESLVASREANATPHLTGQ